MKRTGLNHTFGLTLSTPGLVLFYFPATHEFIFNKIFKSNMKNQQMISIFYFYYNFIPKMLLNAFLNSGLKIVYIKGLRQELM